MLELRLDITLCFYECRQKWAHRAGKVKGRSGVAGPGSPLWALTLLDVTYGMSRGLEEERVFPFSKVL